MNLKGLIGKIPEVAYPEEELTVKDRIKWTALVGAVFLVMSFTWLPGVSIHDLPAFFQLVPTTLMTVLALGVGPILLAVEALQLLMRFNLLKLDLGDIQDRRFFYGLQKILITIIAFFAAVGVVSGFWLAEGLLDSTLIVSLLVFNVIALAYMDEIVVKWGLGSGLGLFVFVGVLRNTVWLLFNTSTGILLDLVDKYFNRGVFDMNIVFIIAATAALIAIVYVGLKKKTELPVSSGRISGKYSMKFFYTSTLAITAAGVLGLVQMLPLLAGVNPYLPEPVTDLQKITQFIARNLSLGELYVILTPENIYKLFDLQVLLHLILYTLVWLILATAVGYACSWIYGLHIPYLKQSPETKIETNKEELKRNVKNAVIVSSFVVGLLTLLGDLFGAIIAFSGALIAIGYLFRCYEEVRGPVKVCPSCGCRGIEWLLPSLWSIWECRNCGYRGIIVIDVEQDG